VFHEHKNITKTIFLYVDFEIMKILTILFIATILLGEKLYETKVSQQNRQVMQNKKIKCRLVCDKKIYKEQKIQEAVLFYKNSKDYKFTKSGF